MTPRPQERSVRIIGGKWRGRKISFASSVAIRPTPDRVRETLFNWLSYPVTGARALELYGGSGVLSFEALSRGAVTADLVELDRDTTRAVERTKDLLDASGLRVHQAEALAWLARNQGPWDIAFVDPPFGTDLLAPITLLADRLTPGGFAYVESPAQLEPDNLPGEYRVHRQKRAGSVHFALLQRV